jgi:hypothetical protein
MIVISTTYGAPNDARNKCIASVPRGTRHVYIDAAEQSTPLSHFENLIAHLGDLPPDEIVVSLDGDDWLLPGALDRIQREHDAGALVTYGSYRYADGRPGHCRTMTPAELAQPRLAPWLASHPKTFRAGLFQKINPEHFRKDGQWLPHARDLALMFPLLEMAGTRAHYIPDILYVYNYANSTEHNADAKTLAYERECVTYVRGLTPYELLTVWP